MSLDGPDVYVHRLLERIRNVTSNSYCNSLQIGSHETVGGAGLEPHLLLGGTTDLQCSHRVQVVFIRNCPRKEAVVRWKQHALQRRGMELPLATPTRSRRLLGEIRGGQISAICRECT